MFWKPEFTIDAQDANEITAMRDELREIARQLRALAVTAPPQPRPVDILGDQIRDQLERIQTRRAA